MSFGEFTGSSSEPAEVASVMSLPHSAATAGDQQFDEASDSGMAVWMKFINSHKLQVYC